MPKATKYVCATGDVLTRAFVAICPPESVLDAVEARTASVEIPGARKTPREQWHITVQFLGNDADIEAVIDALSGLPVPSEMVQLWWAAAIGGHRDRSAVFGLGVAPYEWLRGLAAAVATRLVPLGHEPEARAYLPHLTLARCKRRTDLSAAIEAVGRSPIGEPWLVDRVTVFESRTLREGAVHIARGEIALDNP